MKAKLMTAVKRRKSIPKMSDTVVSFRISVEEKKKLDGICNYCEKSVPDLFRMRILNLTEEEQEAILQNAMVITNYGTILVQGLRRKRSDE